MKQVEEALDEVLSQGNVLYSFSFRHTSRRLLLSDEDMDAMYLSDKKNGLEREDDHEELEVLLESFSKQVEEIVNEAENIEVRTCITTMLLVPGVNHAP